MENTTNKRKRSDLRLIANKLVNKTRLTSNSAIYHMKLPPSTDIWVCEHEVGYPDICEQCLRIRPKMEYRGLLLQESIKPA